MAQGLFGGATSYEEQSIQDILEDIESWNDYTKEINKELIDGQRKLNGCGFLDEIPFNFQMTLHSSIKFHETILHDFELIINAIKNCCITEREVKLLRKIGSQAWQFNREYGKTYKEEYNWKKYGEPDFKIAESMYAKGRDYFVTLQDASNAAGRLEDYMNTIPSVINNTLSIGDNATGVQVQQGTVSSTQTMSVNQEFDYEKVSKVLHEIQTYMDLPMFGSTFKDNTTEVRQVVSQALDMADKKENPTKIKQCLLALKDLAVGAGGNLIATGIQGLLAQISI